MTTTKVSRKSVEHIIRGTFPEYRGRTIKVEHRDTVTLYDLNWSGGTRAQYRACTLEGKALGNADKYNMMHPWRNNAEGAQVPIASGAVLVRHSIFCGKDLGLTIYYNKADALPAS